ncbi:MAG TPA: carboxylating nicotinate-nucleotide diphosphorylase [Flavobacteriales bacterium]|nr:carboxylating nicotinate-nucleotide diphosphorylase [Flavobacteriales bacterium]
MTFSPQQEKLIEALILLSLAEDVGPGDYTTLATVPSDITQKAKLLVKDDGILCGVDIARRVMKAVDPEMQMDQILKDGDIIKKGDIAFYIEGKPGSILTAERLLLNCMQRMSGIATYTNKLVNLIQDTDATLIDTRKTSPGMRVLEKWAVHTGGGGNHRMGLYDMIMIKDNHIDFAGGISQAIDRVHAFMKERNLNLQVEIEARSLADVKTIVEHGGVNRIMLDNFNPSQIQEALPFIPDSFETEASGGINESNLRDYALTGIQFISMGALTHQVRSLDLSLKAC